MTAAAWSPEAPSVLDNPKLSGFEGIRRLHLEPTSRCQAACPMCGRNDRGGRTLATVELTEFSLADIEQWLPVEFLRQLSHAYMCGNLGEPILARDCLPIYAHFRSNNPRLSLGLNTNGSARPVDFWQELAALKVRVNFGIDGATAASHVRYRRGTDFDRILENAAAFIQAGGEAVWDFLVFLHNEHEVEPARKMAKAMGFKSFVVKPTERFYTPYLDVQNAEGLVVDRLEPSLQHAPAARLATPEEQAACRIDCIAARQAGLFISATGHVFPCCYLGQKLKDRPGLPDSVFDRQRAELDPYFAMVDAIGAENLSLRHRSLRTIVDRFLPRFMDGWAPGPCRLPTCAHVCGKPALA